MQKRNCVFPQPTRRALGVGQAPSSQGAPCWCLVAAAFLRLTCLHVQSSVRGRHSVFQSLLVSLLLSCGF